MPRRQTGGKGKNKQKKYKSKKQNKSKPKNVNVNVNYSSEMIEKLAKEIRVMIAKNDDESAMNKINIIQQNLQKTGKILPLILNSLKCVILAQCQEYDALKLLFCEINNLFVTNKYKWDNESLNCLKNACQVSGEINYLLIFLQSAFNNPNKKIIKNENRCRELYFTYFINAKFDKLSQLATKMNRGFNSNSNYNMWAITGGLIDIIINHNNNNNNNNNRDTILKLQQLQFERQYLNNNNNNNKKIENFDALINMYYKILIQRKEYAKLIEFIDSDVIRIGFIDKNKLLLWKLECFKNLNEWYNVNKLCSEMLFNDNDNYNNRFVDDWEIWTNWIHSQFIIHQEKQNAMDGIKLILDIQEKHNKFRGAYLSEIEFNLKLIQFDDSNPAVNQVNQDTLIKLIIKYFKHFANKNPSCFNDIKKYLNYINGKENQKKLIKQLQIGHGDIKQEEENEENEKNEKNSLKRYNLLSQIELYFGEDLLIEKVQILYNKWHLNINKIEKNEKTDETDADELILIAVNILLYLSHKSHNKEQTYSYIMDCILLLELGLISSQYNFRLRLYLLRLYCHPLIGNIHGAYNSFLAMNIRGFQYDSLSHLLYHDALRYGFISKISYLHKEMEDHRREFNIANLRRTPQCFAYNNYHKVIEFAQFNDTMRKSEMFIISQTDFIFCKLINYYIDNMNINMNIVDYLQTLILPNHPYFNLININKKQEEKNEEKEKEKEKEWIDLNDYTTIPMYIDERKESYCHKLIKYPPISTLSNDYDYDYDDKSSKQTKKSHIFLLLLYIEMLYKSLTNNIENMDKKLDNLWNLMKKLNFVKCDDEIKINEMKNILNICNNVCDNNNFHWILVFCFHWLNKMLFIDKNENKNENIIIYNLEIICDKFVLFSDNLGIMINMEGRTKKGLNGIHLFALWRFISILSFTTFTLFKHWINQTKETNKILNKIIIKKYNFLSKAIEQLRRILCDILTHIESQFKIINIEQPDEILKQYHIKDIISHKSNINMDKNLKNKTKLKQIKIAMININNNVAQNNIEILKQNILILKQLRVL